MGIEQSAQSIADALAPSAQSPAVKWRWGTVEAVGEHGTMDVQVGGSTLYGIRASRHCMSAKVGDRVRVSYYGTEAMVDAVRATAGARTDVALARNTTNCSSLGTSWAGSNGVCVTVSIIDAVTSQAIASNGNLEIATIPEGYRPRGNVYSNCFGSNTTCTMRITAAGSISIRNQSGAQKASGSMFAATATYYI